MKKTNFIFAVLMILFAFGQIKAQITDYESYSDIKTKEFIFMKLDKTGNGKHRIWYSPYFASDMQELKITGIPPLDADLDNKGITLFRIQIPNRGEFRLTRERYDSYGTPVVSIEQGNRYQKFADAPPVYVNHKNPQEKLYVLDPDLEMTFLFQSGTQTPQKLEEITLADGSHGGIKLKGGVYYWSQSYEEGYHSFEDRNTGKEVYRFVPLTLE